VADVFDPGDGPAGARHGHLRQLYLEENLVDQVTVSTDRALNLLAKVGADLSYDTDYIRTEILKGIYRRGAERES
jgi:hypothetical protein